MDYPKRRARGSNKGRQRKTSPYLPLIIITVFIISLAASTGVIFINVLAPNNDTADYFEFHGLNPDGIYIIFEDEVLSLTHSPLIHNGEIYLPVEFVEQFIDEWIFWDALTRRLTITDEYFVIRINAGESVYYVNGLPQSLQHPIYYRNGTAFIPRNFLHSQYHREINFAEHGAGALVWINNSTNVPLTAHTEAAAPLRFEPHRWSLVIENLPSGTPLTLLSPYEDIESYLHSRELDRLERLFENALNDNFIRVRTRDGLVGYVLADKIGEGAYTAAPTLPTRPRPEHIPPRPIEGKIIMVWDMMEYRFQNTPWTKNDHHAIDVLSPQWFRFNRETYSGEILSIACMDYMAWAHERGYHIWPKLFDSEDGDVTGLILTNQERREYVIAQILDFIDHYNLDGINIDFERVRQVDIRYFHQFLRELWPPMRERGAILSAAVFVPAAWSLYYDRGAIAQTVDFVAVMTYDEHTIFSPEPGPNASIGFVTTAVQNMVLYPPPGQLPVPPERLLLGIPFYTRVWIEALNDDGSVEYFRVRSLGMNFARRKFTENGAVFEWQEDIGKYYAEFEIFEDGRQRRYRTWLEDDRSMAKKVELVHRYNLAGVAAWVWGLEKEAIWYLLYEELK